MREEGTPTGIRQGDLSGQEGVRYQGHVGYVLKYGFGPESPLEYIVLGFGDRRLALHGYFEGDEFMEVYHELVD